MVIKFGSRTNRCAGAGLFVIVTSAAPAVLGASANNPANEELPRVRVRNIGLHIGGGPNDAATKAPFLRQLAARFDDFRECYRLVESPKGRGTFGIDLLVPKDGGAPETSNVRTSIKGDAFRDCVVTAFQSVTFDKPRRGATKLSYALEFAAE
jgi:hypothetical protein